ncbi:flavocytochrome c [Xylaria nigripes]|nr:flavocytochrome c [Xylaria nigripes]
MASVITVGSGLAGLSAAHAALKAGARVHMLERGAKPGGNSIKASSGINGAGTRFQVERDDAALFYKDSLRSAGARGVGNEKLIEIMTARSADAVDWLVGEFGVDLGRVVRLGGHSAARTHRGSVGPPPGVAIVGGMLKALGAEPGFTLSCGAEVQEFLMGADGKVDGVRYVKDGQTHEVRGPVVFAAGGFAGDARGLLAAYRPDLAGMPSTNEARPAPHRLLEDLGAAFVDMDSVQVHPTGFVDPKDPHATYKFLAAEALRGEGGIMLSADGKRFVDELERRDVISKVMMRGTPSEDAGVRQWEVMLLLDPGACEAAASHLGFYVSKGLMRRVKVKDLSPAVVEAVDAYAAAVAQGRDEAFGRWSFGYWRLPPGEANRDEEVCVGTVTPVTHFTMGGVAFNEKAQILRRDGERLVPVEGLWAAGEITGGIHGDNRLGGSSLLECAIFGRIAGSEAAQSLLGA